MSWVALDDVTNAVHHAITNPGLRGPVNIVAPGAVTNAEFTRVLSSVLNRPALFPMPAFAVRALFGEMGEALLLESIRVEPKRLLESGFRFAYPDLGGALRHLLSREGK
jgi:NAD dependent epimerase/dehydratase family enzyme